MEVPQQWTCRKSDDDMEDCTPLDMLPNFDHAIKNSIVPLGARADVSPYPYQDLPVGYIRLLDILPGDPDSEVCCRLQQYRLDVKLKYTALSYIWGGESIGCKILLDGHRVPVRKNLWRFLKQARQLSSKSPGPYWIDAVCINQADNQERMEQVNQMPKVYRGAASVLIWLGPAYAGSDEAMESLSRRPSQRNPRRDVSAKTADDKNFANALIGLLCMRPYWRRLWIVQEILLARSLTLMCGSKLAPWEPLKQLLLQTNKCVKSQDNAGFTPDFNLSTLHDSVEWKLMSQSPAMAIATQVDGALRNKSLIDLMNITKNHHCAELRDRVYALLGIADKGCEGIKPDYNVPIVALLNIILRNQHQSAPPKDLWDVKHICGQLEDMFGLRKDSVFTLAGHGAMEAPSQHEIFPDIRIGGRHSPVTLWWVLFYGHDAIERIFWHSEKDVTTTPLCDSAKAGKFWTLRLLLERGADPNATEDLTGRTPLQEAIKNGQAEAVKVLLAMGAKMDHKCYTHTSPLISALEHRHLDVVAVLLDHGADATVKHPGPFNGEDNALEHSAFSLVLAKGWIEAAQLIAEQALDVSKTDPQHLWLHIAAKHQFVDGVKLLLEHGADINAANNALSGGGTVLHTSSYQGNHEMVDLLVKRGADIGARDDMGEIPLHKAASNGKIGVVNLLLASGAESHVNNRDHQGCTPLHKAASCLRSDIVRLLLANGANVVAQNNVGQTPLHVAVSHNRLDIVSLLLAKGPRSQVSAQDNRGWTPLHVAASSEYSGLTHVLLANGGDAQVNVPDHQGRIPLHIAASSRRVEIASLLLVHSTDTQVSARDNLGQIPLHAAATCGSHQMSRLLLEVGGDAQINAVDDKGQTPLHLAASSECSECTSLLLMHGAHTQTIAQDRYGSTPLHNAVIAARPDVVSLLLEHDGASQMRVRDSKGRRPRDFETLVFTIEVDIDANYCYRLLKSYHASRADALAPEDCWDPLMDFHDDMKYTFQPSWLNNAPSLDPPSYIGCSPWAKPVCLCKLCLSAAYEPSEGDIAPG